MATLPKVLISLTRGVAFRVRTQAGKGFTDDDDQSKSNSKPTNDVLVHGNIVVQLPHLWRIFIASILVNLVMVNPLLRRV